MGRLDAYPHASPCQCRVHASFLDEVASRYPDDNIVMVLDGAGWHRSESFVLQENLKLHFLPPYSPELNPVEYLWDALREKHVHNRVFDSIGAPEDHLVDAPNHMENDVIRVAGITQWPWIINSVFNAN